MNRRDLIKQMGVMSLVAVSGGGIAKSAPAGTGKNMRVSLAAYSVRDALTSGKMDLFGFIDWCAELGLYGTELTSYYFQEGFDTQYLKRLQHRAFRNGVTISGTAVRNDFCLPPGEEKNREIAHVRKWIDYAAELFAPHIRIFGGDIPKGVETRTAIQWTADGIKAVLDHAAERGIMIGLENHGGVTTLASDHLRICELVGEHPWFGVNLDSGGYRKDPYAELRQAAPLAVNVQVKVDIREGDREVPADWSRVRDILVETNYKGWVALEYEADADPFEAIPPLVQKLKGLIEG